MSLKYTEKLINIKANFYREVQASCKDLLKTHPLAEESRNYLQKRISLENQDKFNLGYFPDDDHLEVLFDKVSEKKIKSLGLVYPYHVQNGDHRVYINKGMLSNHNITIPYYDIYGNIKALVGRTTLSEDDRKDQGLQKYKYTRFSKSLHLFGLYQARQAILEKNSVILVEGQIDCITCHEYGVHNVVAIGGISLSKRQFQLLSRYAQKFYLLLDNDIEGRKAQQRIMKRYANLAKFEILEMPTRYKDVDECLRSGQSNNVFLTKI